MNNLKLPPSPPEPPKGIRYEVEYSNYVRVTFDFKFNKIYIYKTNYGGDEIDSTTIPIKQEWLKDLDIFINEVDKKLEPWIG